MLIPEKYFQKTSICGCPFLQKINFTTNNIKIQLSLINETNSSNS
jgi:hypothetical protein